MWSDFPVVDAVEPGVKSPTILVWARILADVALADAEAALVAYARDTDRGRWPPRPADILDRDPHRWQRDYGDGRHLSRGRLPRMQYSTYNPTTGGYDPLPTPTPIPDDADLATPAMLAAGDDEEDEA